MIVDSSEDKFRGNLKTQTDNTKRSAFNDLRKRSAQRNELAEVLTVLRELSEFIMAQGKKGQQTGSVRFVVNERDIDGKVRSFDVMPLSH